MLINLSNMLIFFSKRASGMLINDMLIKKKYVVIKETCTHLYENSLFILTDDWDPFFSNDSEGWMQ